MSTEWRTRVTYAQNRGRTIERQADGLRQALIVAVDGGEAALGALQSISAIRTQLCLAEDLVKAWQAGRSE